MRRSTLLILSLFVVVIAAFIGLSRLADVAAGHLSQKLQVTVSIDSLGVLPRSLSIRNLQIGNPGGYSLPKALSAKTIDIQAPLTRYLNEAVVIDEIIIDQIDLGLEFDSATSTNGNWSIIMGNLKNSSRSDVLSNPKRSVLIKKLVLTNIRTQLLFRGSGKVQSLPMIDRMEFNDISSSGGIPADQLANNILAQMLKSVFLKQNLQNMLNAILEDPSGAAKSIIKPLQKLIP